MVLCGHRCCGTRRRSVGRRRSRPTVDRRGSAFGRSRTGRRRTSSRSTRSRTPSRATALGVPVAKGVVAVDPKLIPLGTKLHVPGYGPGLAADIGRRDQGQDHRRLVPQRWPRRASGAGARSRSRSTASDDDLRRRPPDLGTQFERDAPRGILALSLCRRSWASLGIRKRRSPPRARASRPSSDEGARARRPRGSPGPNRRDRGRPAGPGRTSSSTTPGSALFRRRSRSSRSRSRRSRCSVRASGSERRCSARRARRARCGTETSVSSAYGDPTLGARTSTGSRAGSPPRGSDA